MISNPSLRKAKNNGMSYEKKFELFCNSKGIGSLYYSKWSKSGVSSFEDDNKILVKEFPYESIYKNSICKTEFVLILNDRRIRIEFKSQNKAGSTDEKIPYLLENVRYSFPEYEIILAILGDGWRPGMKEYIDKQKFRHKKVSIFYDYDELEEYVNDSI
jgi:hypothetical protein|tara:strand:- start:34 stop:510 length:477 start_codon:yes stop_codon:yes gene_type:complete